MSNDRKAVVIVKPQYLYNSDACVFAVRITPLGLTAYGNSRDEASSKVRRMFASAIEAHRLKGDLEEWLNSSKVEWSWLDQYAGDIPVEDVSGTAGPRRSSHGAPNRGQWRDVDSTSVSMAA